MDQGSCANSASSDRKTSTMDVITAIRTRRSIRRYTGARIDDQALHTVLDAGFCAPSASNKRPWHFLVIREQARLQQIAQAHPYAAMVPAAGCCIVVCGDSALQEHIGLLVADCSAAIQNMLLAANGLGLGAVWCGLYIGGDEERLQLHRRFAELLGLAAGIVPVGMIAVGHPAESKPDLERFDAARVHYETWQ